MLNPNKSELSGLKTFARGMLRYIEAVENGINMSWSNGAVDGPPHLKLTASYATLRF